MRSIHILNPAAGLRKANLHVPEGIEVYETEGPRDMEKYITDTCIKDPDVHFMVYGGDGSAHEAVNGIMSAGKAAIEKAILSIVAKGSGNDFVRNFSADKEFSGRVDVIKCNDRYGLNSINIGFDCDVVVETEKMKKNPLTSGSLGYIAGVLKVFSKKMGKEMTVSLKDKSGEVIRRSGEMLLTAVGNGRFCGGGFEFAPAAVLSDGCFDALIVNNMKRLTFVKLILDYHNGKHVDRDTCLVRDKYKGLLGYYQCAEMTVEGISQYSIDGELFDGDKAVISIIPGALNVKMPALDLTKLCKKK